MLWEASVLKNLAVEGKARLSLARTGSEVSSETAAQGAAFLSEATAPPAGPDSQESNLAQEPRPASFPGLEEGTAGTAAAH